MKAALPDFTTSSSQLSSVSSSVAWLVAKRYLWDSNHQLTDTLSTSGWSLAMPMWATGDQITTVAAKNPQVCSLPANHAGDHCRSGENLCGWWNGRGWKTDDNGYPDPEDFTWSDSAGTAGRYVMCMQSESPALPNGTPKLDS